MNMSDNGVAFFEPDDELVEFLIIDGDQRESIFHPTHEDIRVACFQHGVPPEGLIKLVKEKQRGVHTMFLDVQKYLEGLQEKEQTFLLELSKAKGTGYLSPWSYSYDCPMCDYNVDWDLDLGYVEKKALDHLGDGHRVRKQKIRIDIKETQCSE